MIIFQSVLNCLHKINPIIKIYALSLMLSKSRKNCTAMTESIGISRKLFYDFLSESKNHTEHLMTGFLTNELIDEIRNITKLNNLIIK